MAAQPRPLLFVPSSCPPPRCFLQVVVTDADVLWLRNPIPFFERFPDADLLTGSDHLAHTVEGEELEKWPEADSAFNTGGSVGPRGGVEGVWRGGGGSWRAHQVRDSCCFRTPPAVRCPSCCALLHGVLLFSSPPACCPHPGTCATPPGCWGPYMMLCKRPDCCVLQASCCSGAAACRW